MRRLLAGLGMTALLTGGGLALSTPAQAAGCSGTSGVTVVVQSGSSADVRCAPGDPSSAFAALQSAGFSVTRVAPPNAGAICQINAAPSTSCVRMPPASQYWAVFHGPAGGSWTYSNSGADALDPVPGTAVGFRLGSGAAPSVAPPKAPAPPPKAIAQPTPKPTATAPARPTTSAPAADRPAGATAAPGGGTTPAPKSTSAGQPSSATSTQGVTPKSSGATSSSGTSAKASQEAKAKKSAAAKKRASSSSSRSRTGDGDTPNALPSQRSSSSDVTAAGAPGDDGSDSGSGALVPTAIGGGLLLALGGGALVMARRRGL